MWSRSTFLDPSHQALSLQWCFFFGRRFLMTLGIFGGDPSGVEPDKELDRRHHEYFRRHKESNVVEVVRECGHSFREHKRFGPKLYKQPPPYAPLPRSADRAPRSPHTSHTGHGVQRVGVTRLWLCRLASGSAHFGLCAAHDPTSGLHAAVWPLSGVRGDRADRASLKASSLMGHASCSWIMVMHSGTKYNYDY